MFSSRGESTQTLWVSKLGHFICVKPFRETSYRARDYVINISEQSDSKQVFSVAYIYNPINSSGFLNVSVNFNRRCMKLATHITLTPVVHYYTLY